MFKKLRSYSKYIIIIIVAAMVITGIYYGIGRFGNVSIRDLEVAVVNGKSILYQDYYNYTRQNLLGVSLTRAQEMPVRYQLLNTMINTELVFQEADKLGIKEKVTEEDIDEYLNEYLEYFQMTEEELKTELEKDKKSIADFRKDVRTVLGSNSRIEQVQELAYADVHVTEQEIINEYEEIKLQLIEKAFAEDKEKAEQSIKEALMKINEGSDFAVIAEEYSDFYTVEPGMFSRKNSLLPDDITEKAFSLEIGQLSEIIEDESSYYLIKILDKKLAEGEEYEEAKEELRENLLKEKQQEAFTEWLLKLREESEIIIKDPLLSGYHGLVNGDYEFAISELEKALEEGYVYPMTYAYLSQAYLNNEQIEKAIEAYDRAIENYPEDWELYYNYGMMLYTLEEPYQEKALSMLDNASAFAGEDIIAHYQLYIAYLQFGESEKAEYERNRINEINEKMMELQEEQTQASEELDSEDENIEDNADNDDNVIPESGETESNDIPENDE